MNDDIEKLPVTLNLKKVFGVDGKISTGVKLETIETIFHRGDGPGHITVTQARRIFEETITAMQRHEHELNFAVTVFEALNNPKASELRERRDQIIADYRAFYDEVLKPYRYFYKVFSLVPLSQGSLDTLQEELKIKLNNAVDLIQ